MAEGFLSLQIVGASNRPETTAVGDWLLLITRMDPNMKQLNTGGWPFMGTFAHRVAFKHRDAPAAETESRQFAERNLVIGQSADGAWTDNFEGRHVGRVYCTSLAVLTLAAKYRHLPLYQL